MAIGKFNRPAAGKPPAKKKSRYAGIKESSKEPMPTEGRYRFRLIGYEFATHPKSGRNSIKMHFSVVSASNGTPEGAQQLALFFLTSAGQSDLKKSIRAVSGFDSEEEYDEFDPEGEFIGYVAEGEQNDYSHIVVEGRLFDAIVTYGGDVINKETGQPTGDKYRNYSWAVVPEDEQDEAPCALAQAAQ